MSAIPPSKTPDKRSRRTEAAAPPSIVEDRACYSLMITWATMLPTSVSVDATPGGSWPPAKNTEAGAENTTPEQVVVVWLRWALPPP